MNKRLAVALTVAVVFGVGVMSQGCEPDCSGMNAGDKVPDSKNCSQYYICLGDGLPSDHAVPCEPGHEFPDGATGCQPIGNPPCTASCESPTCRLTCNGSLDIIASLVSCSQYYICGPGGSLDGPYECPSDRPVFDGENCVKDETKCCEGYCTPYCTGMVEVPDPHDCSKYYICLEDGPVDESLHYTCPAGENFDVAAGRCVPGAPCTVLCPDGMRLPWGHVLRSKGRN